MVNPSRRHADGRDYGIPLGCYPLLMAKRPEPKTANVSAEEAKRRHDVMDQAIRNFRGQLDELESALGMYMIGRHLGWKPLYIIHSKRTVAKYEAILGIDVREEFEPETEDSRRSIGFLAVQKISNFWKAVSGEEKLPVEREDRRSIE